MKPLTRTEQDYVAALVQLSKQTQLYNPRLHKRKEKSMVPYGSLLPIQTINGFPVKQAIQLVLGERDG